MQKITPFLWFDNNAEEAMNFYTSVFKDSKILSASRYPQGGGSPGEIMVAHIELNGQQLYLMNGGPLFKFTEAISLTINCENQEEVDYYWNHLTADGGEESQCGWLKDKFGLSWQVTPAIMAKLMTDPDRTKSDRVMQSMLTTKKLDIAQLQRAYDGL